MLTLAFNIQPVKASGTIYIRADGSIDPSTAPISTVDNVTYTFTDNINDSIVIERDNIMVDGAAYTLQGTNVYGSRGTDVTGRSNLTIKNININNYTYGIYLVGSSRNNSISGNNITNNEAGILLYSSWNNNISGNNITNNRYGIYLHYSLGNSIFHNNFINNTQQVFVQLLGYANVWDDGYPSGGNYWSDYNGTDANHDGIGDTPYIIDADNADRYPLMNLWGRLLGDINGDGIVDIYDAILLANAYNSTPEKVNWNPNADINGDNIVDIYDARILANHFNQRLP